LRWGTSASTAKRSMPPGLPSSIPGRSNRWRSKPPCRRIWCNYCQFCGII